MHMQMLSMRACQYLYCTTQGVSKQLYHRRHTSNSSVFVRSPGRLGSSVGTLEVKLTPFMYCRSWVRPPVKSHELDFFVT